MFFMQHFIQEALGLAVAQEMQKIYQKELEPKPIPRTLPGTIVDEEDVSDGFYLNSNQNSKYFMWLF